MNISCSDEGNGVGDGAYLLMPGYNPDILDDGIIRRAVDKFKVTHEGYKIVPETVTVTDNYYFQGVVGKMVKSGSKQPRHAVIIKRQAAMSAVFCVRRNIGR